MRRVMFVGLASMAMALAACSDGNIGDVQTEPGAANPVPEAVSNLVLDEQTDTRVAGRLQTADGELTFVATFSAARLTVSITVNGKRFDASHEGATTIIDGHDTVLTEADANLLRTFTQAFDAKVAGLPVNEPNSGVYRLASMLSIAPSNYVHKRLESVEVLAWSEDAGPFPGNEGTKCIPKGTTVNAEYTAVPMAWGGKVDAGAKGSYYVTDGGPNGGPLNMITEPVLVGSNWGKIKPRTGATTWSSTASSDYNCMGKCGAACSILGGGYTKDCLDHDTCSYRYMSYGGASDTYCGDEYSQASEEIFNSCPK